MMLTSASASAAAGGPGSVSPATSVAKPMASGRASAPGTRSAATVSARARLVVMVGSETLQHDLADHVPALEQRVGAAEVGGGDRAEVGGGRRLEGAGLDERGRLVEAVVLGHHVGGL